MDNPQLTLVVVMQNAVASGMTVAEAVQEMIEVEPSQSGSIVATAMIVSPGEFVAIINAAIGAGADASGVVAAALVATDGENSDNIVAAAIRAAPGQASAINAASERVLAQVEPSPAEPTVQATSGELAETTVAQGSGGGAVATADILVELIEIIASISGDAPQT
jgi:mannitol-specific phosphotransferase system IIBC component